LIYFDGIIYKLQKGGGISILFDEIISRLPQSDYTLNVPERLTIGQRYLDLSLNTNFKVFHSTYYRLPKNKSENTITTVHDFTYERFVSGASKRVHSWQKNRAIKNSSEIICVSESTKNDLIYFLGDRFEKLITVIHNGVSSDYRPLSDIVPDSQVLFVGSRFGYKNFSAAALAVSRFSDLKLVCVGGGGFTRKENKFLESHLTGRHYHLGYLSNSDLNVELNRSICLLYPSLYEGFGIPVIEAMRSGCPVVAVNSSSIPEISDGAAYLLERGSVEEIVDAIDFFYIKDNRELFIKLGARQALNFSWDLTFKKTLQVYNKYLV
jgi:mannosyltransferase